MGCKIVLCLEVDSASSLKLILGSFFDHLVQIIADWVASTCELEHGSFVELTH